MIYSYDLEQQLIAALIKYPEKYAEIASFVSEKDFFSESNNVNKIIFLCLKQLLEIGQKCDEVVLSQRVKGFGVTFEENINIADYIQSLALKRVSPDAVVDIAKELKKITVRREIAAACLDISKKMKSMPPSMGYVDIIQSADKIYNSQINLFETTSEKPVNIYDDMEQIIEERGNNPVEEFGLMGPHPKINEIYGSLLRPGNITVIVSRSGVGKAMPWYQKIKTPDGWTNHRDVKVGDLVLNRYGLPVKVTGHFPQGEKDVYRLIFNFSLSADCCKEHLWGCYVSHFSLGGETEWRVLKTETIKHLINFGWKIQIPTLGGMRLFVQKIEYLNKQELQYCISIDDPEHLYVTDNEILTHNTQFAMDYCTKVSQKYKVPVLHFDNGEMSKEELIMRQTAALSGVPLHLLESGNWRRAGPAIVEKVRSVWTKIKDLEFYYYNVGGQSVDSMITCLKRYYYSEIGRGNPLIFSFDYIKASSESDGNREEWQTVGEMVDKLKRCVQKDIVVDGKPQISLFTSVQANRTGVVTNKKASEIIDNESIVSLSDRINHFCSHLFILREKTLDEISLYPDFGTHKLINLKRRHLGKDVAGALFPVKMQDGSLERNFINLEFKNFSITEKGDLRDIVKSLDPNQNMAKTKAPDDDPPM